MNKSRHNIFAKIQDSDNYLLVNLLHGQADILDPQTAAAYESADYKDQEEFVAKKYLIEAAEEKAIFKNKYLDFLDTRDNDEIQLFYVPWYACNFNCSYCYQEGYENDDSSIDYEALKAFFTYIKTEFAGQRKYITLFGGEPLLPGKKAREFLDVFFSMAGENGVDVAIVTNGYHLKDHIDLFSKCKIREVQVTLDGTADVHDKRRPLKKGKVGTFNQISEGIDRLIEEGYAVNLRVVVDKENINVLPDLAAWARQKGWLDYAGFKTQLGRNYELHYCQSSADKLFTRAGLYEEIYALLDQHPEILEFHKPLFSVARFLSENGELPDPLFDACPACKTEWAFDYSGKIYPCTANVGKSGDEVGTYYPERYLNAEKIEEWESRDITAIEKCKTCEVSLACGGGCGSVALNQTGMINGPDCNPVKRLLELGISQYFEKE